MILIIMGVCGSGKTTVGKALAAKLSYKFYDADDFHPQENKQKMAASIRLTDEDRLPWLCVLNKQIKCWYDGQNNAILACSALKKSYRLQLISGLLQNKEASGKKPCSKPKNVVFVYLNGSIECISERISKRKDHFMPVTLLESQFQDLEEPENPENFISIGISGTVKEIVSEIIDKICIQ